MILPVYAGLERIPSSLLEASADLGAHGGRTLRRIVLPLALPAVAAGSIFTFSLTLGDYITPQLVSSTQFIGNVVYINVGVANNLPFAAAFATVPVAVMVVYLLLARRAGAFESLMTSRAGTWFLRGATALTLAFIYLPLFVICLYAFNERRSLVWPIQGLTTKWFGRAIDNPGVRDALLLSREGGARRDRDRAPARLAGGACRRAPPLLRPRGDLVPRHPPDRAAGDRHRHGAERDLPQPPRAVRRRPRPLHDHGRARDLLHRRRLQQRRRAAAADGGVARGGLRRSRRGRLADVPLRHVPAAEDGAARGRAARVRAQLRRGDRDHVHRRAPTRRCRSGS